MGSCPLEATTTTTSERASGVLTIPTLSFFLSLSFSLRSQCDTEICTCSGAPWPERERRAGIEAADRNEEAGEGARQQREEAADAAAVADDADGVGFDIVVRMCVSLVPHATIPVLVKMSSKADREVRICLLLSTLWRAKEKQEKVGARQI
jgi:hypothetical protein